MRYLRTANKMKETPVQGTVLTPLQELRMDHFKPPNLKERYGSLFWFCLKNSKKEGCLQTFRVLGKKKKMQNLQQILLEPFSLTLQNLCFRKRKQKE